MKKLTTGKAIIDLLHAQYASGRRNPPRYTTAEVKRIDRALETLDITDDERTIIKNIMEA